MTSDSIIKTTDYCANVVYQDGRRTRTNPPLTTYRESSASSDQNLVFTI